VILDAPTRADGDRASFSGIGEQSLYRIRKRWRITRLDQ
jgi:hypothetical protein